MVECIDRAEHGDRFLVAGEFRPLGVIFKDLEALTGVRGPTMRLPHWLMMTFAFLEETRVKVFGGKVLVSREAVRMLRWEHKVSSARAVAKLGATFRPFTETARDVVAWYSEHGYFAKTPLLPAPAVAR
jgi:dihydroflavonol-4-reductase